MLAILCLLLCFAGARAQATPLKEWTFLVFLNGHNNLDPFGELNMDQMQEVGSSDQLNIVVQWASSSHPTTRRVYVNKGSHTVIEDLPRVDMGKWQNLVEFAQWGAQNYPAKHYFINIWNHGGGWHRVLVDGKNLNAQKSSGFQTQDISWDDFTGSKITTEELGTAMKEIASILGQKIDIYGSDACLMAMAEVAAEVQDSVHYMVGSEEVEPGQGWPYSLFLKRWTADPFAGGAQVSAILADEYLKAYSGGIYGTRAVTLSAMDLTKMPALTQSMAHLASAMSALSPADFVQSKKIASATQDYSFSDYKDLGDFIARLKAQPQIQLNAGILSDVQTALAQVIVVNRVSPAYKDSHGMAIWLPTSSWDWQQYQERYRGLRFDQDTQWSRVLEKLQ
jgi:hypothetical protein